MSRRGTITWKPSRNGWEVQISLGTDAQGNRRRRTKLIRGQNTPTSRKRDAEPVLTKMLADADAQTVTDSSATIGQLLEQWFVVRSRTTWSPTTAANYRRIIDRRLTPKWGRVKLRDLRRSDLMAWHDELFADGVSLPTVRRFHGVLRAALSYAVERELLAANPASSRGMLQTERRAPVTPPSPEELVAVLALIDEGEPAFGAFVRVASWCGLRRSEMCGLQWGDIDFPGGEVTVHQAVVQIGRRLHVKDTKTHQVRRLSIGPILADVLKAHRDRELDAGVEIRPHGFVWSRATDGSEPWTPDSVTARWSRARTKAGVTCRLHDLRHYMATQLLDQGETIPTVQARLGHSKASTTLDIYSHAIRARDRQAAVTIEQLGGHQQARPSDGQR